MYTNLLSVFNFKSNPPFKTWNASRYSGAATSPVHVLTSSTVRSSRLPSTYSWFAVQRSFKMIFSSLSFARLKRIVHFRTCASSSDWDPHLENFSFPGSSSGSASTCTSLTVPSKLGCVISPEVTASVHFASNVIAISLFNGFFEK